MRVDGFDLDEASVALARANVAESGLDDRVSISARDAGERFLTERPESPASEVMSPHQRARRCRNRGLDSPIALKKSEHPPMVCGMLSAIAVIVSLFSRHSRAKVMLSLSLFALPLVVSCKGEKPADQIDSDGDDVADGGAQWRQELYQRRQLSADAMILDFSAYLDNQAGSLCPKDDLTLLILEIK